MQIGEVRRRLEVASAGHLVLFKQQGAIRALGTAVIAAHPQLARTLAEHGHDLDSVNGEVVELEPFNGVMSKRSAQIKNLERLETEWKNGILVRCWVR